MIQWITYNGSPLQWNYSITFCSSTTIGDRVTWVKYIVYLVLCEKRGKVHPFLDTISMILMFRNSLRKWERAFLCNTFFFSKKKLKNINLIFSHERRTMAVAFGVKRDTQNCIITTTHTNEILLKIREELFVFCSLAIGKRESERAKNTQKYWENEGKQMKSPTLKMVLLKSDDRNRASTVCVI